jgi:hypothetical protein
MRDLVLRLLLLIGLAPLWGCGGQASFSKLMADNLLPAPPISLAALDGLPPQVAGQFTQAMRVSAAKRGIRLVQGDFARDQGLRLSGVFGSVPQAGLVRVSHDWRLTDAKGRELMSLSSAEEGAGVEAYPPELLGRMAETLCEALSSRLTQLGYSARAAGIPPPPDAFELAGPGAEKDLDYETLLGPNPSPELVSVTVPMPESEPAPPPEPQKPVGKASGPVISAVAVVPVTGALGQGNAELRAAMKKVLSGAGWPVLDAPRADALTISGKVELSAPQGANQRVVLSWTVQRPDGSEVGVVRQANDVPAGSLNAGWGETAQYAAQAAGPGIGDIVQQMR